MPSVKVPPVSTATREGAFRGFGSGFIDCGGYHVGPMKRINRTNPVSRSPHGRGLAYGRALLTSVLLLAITSYVVIAGRTGFCPMCASIVGLFGGARVETTSGPGETSEADPGPVHQLVMTDLLGKRVPLSDFSGRPMLIDVWATWCGPCRKARTVLRGIADEVERHGSMISISVDRGGPEVVRAHIDRHEGGSSPFIELVSTDPRLDETLRPHDRSPTIPKLVFVDAFGRIVDIEYGVPRADWVLQRLKVLAGAGSKG